MFHALNNKALYSAFKVECMFINDFNKTKSVSGTGFFITYDNVLYLVTNRHVVDIRYTDKKGELYGFKLAKTTICGRFSDGGDDLMTLDVPMPDNRIFYSKNDMNDIACIRRPKVSVVSGNCTNIIINNLIGNEMIANENDFLNNISVCDFVAFPGYPEWHDNVRSRPIFRTGTIASDPRFDYSHYKEMGNCVAYEAFSSGGASGSPVFAMQKGLEPGPGIKFDGFRRAMFIGINAGHMFVDGDKNNHAGISYFYKSTAIIQSIIDDNFLQEGGSN